jgi:hypothetical protein
MRKLVYIFLILIISSSNIFSQKVDEVFDNYYNATGGLILWNQVQTYVLKQTYASSTGSDYDVEIMVSMPDQSILKTKTIMKRGFIYGVNSTDAFYKIPTGSRDRAPVYQVKDLSEKEKANMKREISDALLPFLNYQNKSYIATYVGLESEGTQNIHHIELAGKDIKYDLYFNTVTSLLSKQKETLAGGEVITKEFLTYATSDLGIKYPATGTYYSNVDKRNVKLTSAFVFNVPLSSSVFKR